jgi:N-acetylneuraminate synthase
VTSFTIGRREVGPDEPTYFIADIAANHDGDLNRALRLVELAAGAGADAAKFQNFKAETIVSEFGFRSLGGQRSHQAAWTKSVTEVYSDASIPVDWSPILEEHCLSCGIDYLTAPYDLDMIDGLAPHVCAWKVGSGDITWHESIDLLARTGKPLLLATGASSMDDVREAMAVAMQHCDRIVLMQCNTNYTGDLDNFRFVALRVLETYAAEFPQAVLGLSDHTPGHATVLGAVVLGARVVEKHFTDNRARAGPDHAFSMEPSDWRSMVDRTRELEAALGEPTKRIMDNESETAVLQRRAIRAAHRLEEGALLVRSDLAMLRPCPAEGVPPSRLKDVLGRRLRRTVEAGDALQLDDLL